MATALPAIDYDFGVNCTPEYRVNEVQFEGFYSQRSVNGPQSERQVWKITWTKLPAADLTTLRNFFRGLRGISAFSWQPPEEAAPLKFIPRSPQYSKDGVDSWTFTITGLQTFDNAA